MLTCSLRLQQVLSNNSARIFMPNINDKLESQIENKRKEIHTDSYPMSIGEIVNLYQDGELDIHPEFQRIYRWSATQKSRLIESILLGIPLPSFFMAQRDDGVWDVVDGLQRLSTIFSFLGIYRNEKNELEEPLKLMGTEYLPALENVYWSQDFCQKTNDPQSSYLSKNLQISFKREKIDLKIIKKESDTNTKYELFHRLNTFGSSLSDQEVRNCILIMMDQKMFSWIQKLSENENFQATIPLTDKQLNEKFHMELILRFIILRNKPDVSYKDLEDLGDFLTKEMKNTLFSENFNPQQEEIIFKKTFTLLNKALSENAFRRYTPSKGEYQGPFSLSIFEVLSLGLAFNLDSYDENNKMDIKKIENISKDLINHNEFTSNSASGTRANKRLPKFIPFSKTLFEK